MCPLLDGRKLALSHHHQTQLLDQRQSETIDAAFFDDNASMNPNYVHLAMLLRTLPSTIHRSDSIIPRSIADFLLFWTILVADCQVGRAD